MALGKGVRAWARRAAGRVTRRGRGQRRTVVVLNNGGKLVVERTYEIGPAGDA